ncbi:hypothetical protein C0431_12610 [bacterium]|nr:hypothetical protein [bacterium]
MNQEDRFRIDDERDRIASIELNRDMYRSFEEKYKLSEVVTGHRRLLYDQKNTIRRRTLIPDTDGPQVWMLGPKLQAEYSYQVTLLTFEDEVYNHLVRNLYNVHPEDLSDALVHLIDDPNVCSFIRL